MIAFSGDSASCECVSGASFVDDASGEGDCLFDNQCLSNDDCDDETAPFCNEQGGCSNPCDIQVCGANEICSLDESLAAICDCDLGFYRSDNTLCVLEGSCGNNNDCEPSIPLCEASVCTDPCVDACLEYQDCSVTTDLTASCSCIADYQDKDGDSICKPACAIAGCSLDASCDDSSGTAVCTCGPGFEGNGQTCEDIDGCADSPCAANVTCTDTPAPGDGYSRGSCPEGYIGSGTVCDADMFDDCAPIPCLNGGICTDLGVLDFECDCDGTGFIGTTCDSNINDCDGNPCDVGGSCSDGVNSFTCSCADGYAGGGLNTACAIDFNDDCTEIICGAGGSCEDTGVNSYDCLCEDGYTGGGANAACVVDFTDDCRYRDLWSWW